MFSTATLSRHQCLVGFCQRTNFQFAAFQGKLDAIDMDKAVDFVLSCMNFDGGFGCRPGSESHAGQVNCN